MSTRINRTSFLSGLRVLDLADEKASFCSELLVGVGATVIKVEPPGGDASRKIPPFFSTGLETEDSLFFWYNNAGKLGISLDLTAEKERFFKLAAQADVIVESFTPGYLDNLGIGYKTLSRINPGLVAASVTGFGQNGPQSKFRAYDLTASASGGQLYISGQPDRPPLKLYGFQSYYVASLYAACGILLALCWRRRSGRGQHIDTSLQESVASALEHVLLRYFSDGTIARRQGSLQWNGSSDLFRCKDGYAMLTLNNDWAMVADVAGWQGFSSWVREADWRDEAFRSANLELLRKELSAWAITLSGDDLFRLGQELRLPWARINSIEDVCNNAQLKEREFMAEASHPLVHRKFKAPRPVINPDPDFVWQKAPSPGEHDTNLPDWTSPSEKRKDLACAANNELPLEGIRVLDFTWLLAGPYATRLLADFGAEVIKVQCRKTANGAEDNNAPYFAAWNRNKLGITLDMSRPEARELARGLVRKCDIVIENFTPRVMENWQLDYGFLKKLKPDLIMASLSGFGHSGPWRNYTALGATIQALSGLTGLTSCGDGTPCGPGFAYSDHIAGLYATLGILSALEHRSKTGEGTYLDISEFEAVCSLLGSELIDFSLSGNQPSGLMNDPEAAKAAPYGCYRCKGHDRWCAIAVFNDDDWHRLIDIMGNPAWARSAKFTTIEDRIHNSTSLDANIENWTSGQTAQQVMLSLQQAGIPAAVVNDAAELAADQHLKERGFFTDLIHPLLGKQVTDGVPIRLSQTPGRIGKAAPLLGEDNRKIFVDLLGIDEQVYQRYVSDGIIG